MMGVLRAGLVALYLFALATFLVPMPEAVAQYARWAAVGLLVVHLLEVPLVFGVLRRDAAPLAQGIGLTLIFGFLYWLPIKKAQGQGGPAPSSS